MVLHYDTNAKNRLKLAWLAWKEERNIEDQNEVLKEKAHDLEQAKIVRAIKKKGNNDKIGALKSEAEATEQA